MEKQKQNITDTKIKLKQSILQWKTNIMDSKPWIKPKQEKVED